jgi:hypothetical protein
MILIPDMREVVITLILFLWVIFVSHFLTRII